MLRTALHYTTFFARSLAVSTIACISAFGCLIAQAPEKPRSAVNSGMYIIVGEVIGYTEPISDPNNFRGTAIGAKLKITESIQFPYFQNDYVEVFMFGHDPDCFPSTSGYKPQIGARYRLALYPARLVASMSGSHMRLESRVFDRIAPDETMFGFSTTANLVFDYKNDLLPLVQKFKTPEMENKRRWLDDFLYIETSKDLLRLQRAVSEAARLEILERLLYCPNINYRLLLSSEIGKPLPVGEDFTFLLQPGPVKVRRPRKLTKIENRLWSERTRLENSGELNIWK